MGFYRLRSSQRHVTHLTHLPILFFQERLVEAGESRAAELALARDRLALRISELEAAVQDTDTRRRLELMEEQHKQVWGVEDAEVVAMPSIERRSGVWKVWR